MWNSITNTNGYRDGDGNRNRNTDGNRDGYTDCNCNGHTNSYSYAKTHSNPETPSHTKAPSHPTASSVTEAKQLPGFESKKIGIRWNALSLTRWLWSDIGFGRNRSTFLSSDRDYKSTSSALTALVHASPPRDGFAVANLGHRPRYSGCQNQR